MLVLEILVTTRFIRTSINKIHFYKTHRQQQPQPGEAAVARRPSLAQQRGAVNHPRAHGVRLDEQAVHVPRVRPVHTALRCEEKSSHAWSGLDPRGGCRARSSQRRHSWSWPTAA